MIRRLRLPFYVCAVLLASVETVPKASAHPTESNLRIVTPQAEVHGTLLMPHIEAKLPCVVILGGTLSQDRDGRLFDKNAPPRDALKRLAEALDGGGYASFRYDRVGYGLSKPAAKWTGTYGDEAAVAAAVIERIRKDGRFDKVIVIGESAGAYVACLAAKAGTQADGYIFLGGFCGPSEELYEYNFGSLVKYADSSAERGQWASSKTRYELALGRHYREMLAAAAEGKNDFACDDNGFAFKIGGLARRREELAMRPDEMFAQIKAPLLALAGDRDRNVPAQHAAKIVEIAKTAGNKDATHEVLAGLDHSFQEVPADEVTQMRERHEKTSFLRPYSAKPYHALITWLNKRFPTPAELHAEQVEQAASRPTANPQSNAVENTSTIRAKDKPEIDPLTENTPERLQLAPGIEIIPDITDAKKTAGVPTLEGRIGPLLLAEGCQAHFIEMQGGMFVGEHPHSTESIIYTVRGQWVLCSSGRRQLMKPGSLFRFGRNVPTGYEVPFAEPAFILIFKGDRTTKEEKEFIDYLKGMAARIEKEHKDGIPYLLTDLPQDHAARVFARQVNLKFGTSK